MLSKHRKHNLLGLLIRCRPLTGLVLATLMASPGLAQLRSGSNSRRLYKSESETIRTSDSDEAPEEAVEDAPTRKSRPGKAAVVSASHVESESVRPASAKAPVRRATASQVVPAGCTSCGNGRISGSTVVDTQSPMIEGISGDEGYLDGGCSSCDAVGGCGSCDSCGCDDYCGIPCGPSPLQTLLCRLSIRAEAPLFWRRPQSTPPLVTTATAGTDSDLAGELGQNTTQILRTGLFNDGVRAGGRITLSTWLDDCQYHGVMFRYWNAGSFSDSTTYDSTNFPILARPFTNTTTGTATADTQLIAFPGDSIGSINVNSSAKLYGMDLLFRKMAYADRFTRFDWVYGYHHTLIGERLQIASQTTVTGAVGGLQGSTIAVTDNFQTENRFHGFAMGFMSTRRIAQLQLETTFRLTAGNLERQVNISGNTTTVAGGATNQTNQGLLARNTNIRSIKSNTFALAPEVGVNLAYALGPNLDFSIGYNYLMVPKVAQAGRQIDPRLRVNLSDPLTGSQDPGFAFNTGRYWVRSLGLGAQLRY